MRDASEFVPAYYRLLRHQSFRERSKGVPYARCAEYPAVVAQLEPEPEDRILDVGSRYSLFPQLLALQYGSRVCAVDPEGDFAERQLAIARRSSEVQPLIDAGRLEFLVADAGRLPHPDGHFTKIAAISVLEHIVDETKVVRELARVLAPGGRLVISVPFDPWRDEPKYYRGNAYITHGSDESFYQRYYNERNLEERLVAPSGLRLTRKSYYGEPGFNAHNLLFGNGRIPWYVRRVLFQPFAPRLARSLIRELAPAQFRHKDKMYTADVAVLSLERPR